MSPIVDCPICSNHHWQNTSRAREMFSGTWFQLARCESCGLVRTRDDLTAEQLRSSYCYHGDADAGHRFHHLLDPLVAQFRRYRVRSIRRLRAHPGRILDVGCGRGLLLSALGQRGWDVRGTEIDEQVAETAQRQLGDRVRVGSIDVWRGDGPFDVISFWHVLEHLAEPRQVLEAAVRQLAPGGGILVAVPNFASWQARVTGTDWLHLDVPRHRWHFTPPLLERLARSVGLRLAHTSHFSLEYGPFGWLQSLLAKTPLGHTLFTDVLRPNPRAHPERTRAVWTHLSLAAPLLGLSVASLSIEAVAALSRSGGCVTMSFVPATSARTEASHVTRG